MFLSPTVYSNLEVIGKEVYQTNQPEDEGRRKGGMLMEVRRLLAELYRQTQDQTESRGISAKILYSR